ncbi:transposase [Sphingomonas sp. PAMC 26605]|uniref:transposase n=1 Tax=Sphingomonas sp. PAMC 26605 TaxID=1112214 RepID=UPI00026CD1F6
MGAGTILAGPERRRRWSDEQREQILAEAFQSGARVCDVARRHQVARGLIYEWRRAIDARRPGLRVGGAGGRATRASERAHYRCRFRFTGRRAAEDLCFGVPCLDGSGLEGEAILPSDARVWIAMAIPT